MKKFILTCVFLLLLLMSPAHIHAAESTYVLPYPGIMPGSIFYKPHLFFDSLLSFWYFGDFGQFDYSLKLSDKSLVEAKTLFEYKQYLLGLKALQRSNYYFLNISPSLESALKDRKNVQEKEKIFQSALLKHVEVLSHMQKEVPQVVLWNPEKSSSSQLELGKEIEKAIKIRKDYL